MGKQISKMEIPAFVPREDLLQQLKRWAMSVGQLDGAANFGLPMRIEEYFHEDGDEWGFIVSIIRDGVTLTQVPLSSV